MNCIPGMSIHYIDIMAYIFILIFLYVYSYNDYFLFTFIMIIQKAHSIKAIRIPALIVPYLIMAAMAGHANHVIRYIYHIIH